MLMLPEIEGRICKVKSAQGLRMPSETNEQMQIQSKLAEFYTTLVNKRVLITGST